MRILITGGTGYFGRGFVKHLLDNEPFITVCVYSRDEAKQADMRLSLNDDPRLRWFIGDVRDCVRLKRALRDVDVVVHAAALKRIEVGRYNADEMVKTNVLGSMNVVEAATDAGVRKAVFLSTDKAYQPVSPYGQSKALAESIFLQTNESRGFRGPRFSVCRYGNISGSTWSIIPTWRKILQKSDTVPVTDPGCTRFWMTRDQAIKLVIDTLEIMPDEVVIPDNLPAYAVGDLAKAMGANMDIKGLGKHEKKHEGMSDNHLSNKARRMSVEELREALTHVE